VDAVVLAAGRASRMGRPKHLLPVDGVPMLERVVGALRRSRVREVIVVLRPDDRPGAELAARLGVRVGTVGDPGRGREASVRAGLEALGEDQDGILFALADQPFLEPEDFDRLVGRFAGGDAGIVHATYGGERGSPVLFAAAYRPELVALQAGEGGRVVVRRHPKDVVGVALPPERGRDVDRPADLAGVR
jgi:molybdenum cofactor cytidylyltransferase